jgi:soluble lytic murein transglycosylase
MERGELDGTCDLFAEAARSPVASIQARARLAEVQCRIAAGDRGARMGVAKLLQRYPGLPEADRLRREVHLPIPAPEEPTKAFAGSGRWVRPTPGEQADAMVGRRPPNAISPTQRLMAADLYLQGARYEDAWRFYAAVPQKLLNPEAQFHRAWAAFRADQLDDARRMMTPLAHRGDEAARYWLSQIDERQGQHWDAMIALSDLANQDPPTYYGLWARARLARALSGLDTPVELDGRPATRPDAPPDGEVLATLDSLVASHGAEFPWLARARALYSVGLRTDAAEELRALEDAYRQARGVAPREGGILRLWRGPRPWIRVPQDLRRARSVLERASIRQIASVASACGDAGLAIRLDHPGWDLRALHVRAYPDLVLDAATRHSIDPDLLWAIMFRESGFNRDAISHANAIGLMQVIPPTGRAIASQRGIDDFDPTDLTDPATAVDFGAYYLAGLLDRFDGRLPLAIASYNGGPHNVERWLALRPDTPMDQFLEEIPFTETKRYVRRVLVSLAIFQEPPAAPGAGEAERGPAELSVR